MKTKHLVGPPGLRKSQWEGRGWEGKNYPPTHPIPPPQILYPLLLYYCYGCCVKVGGCRRILVCCLGCRWVVFDGLMLKNEQGRASSAPVLGLTNS